LAFEFALNTVSVVRWYLEGETEYYATRAVLPQAAAGGIELHNVRGDLGRERGNAARKLVDELRQDREVHRFSFISFDTDVEANLRVIRRQVEEGSIIGYVNANTPDFEFANFTVDELVEVAARLDEAQGTSGDALRHGDWTGILNARDFEHRYCTLSSRRPRGLKGAVWGAALGEFAAEVPHLGGAGRLRPFLEAVDQALRARRVRYEHQRDHLQINPESFQTERRPEAAS
jgi:hypothetical protein